MSNASSGVLTVKELDHALGREQAGANAFAVYLLYLRSETFACERQYEEKFI